MIYETTFLFLPTLASDELATQVGKLKEVITANGGEIISEEYPQAIELAYEIRHRAENKYNHHTTANLGWVKYEAAPEAAGEIKKGLDMIKTLLRYLTQKTVKDNTMISKDVFSILQGKEVVKAPFRESKEEKVEAAPAPKEEAEVSEEKVDEELDKMLDEPSEGEAEEKSTEEAES